MTEVQAQSIETSVAPSTEASIVESAPVEVAAAAVEDKNFLASLPEELRDIKALQGFKSAADLAKSYANQLSLLGKKVDDWGVEDIAKFAPKLGRPENAEGYIIPDELSNKSEFMKTAFDAGLNQSQAKALADKMIEAQRASKAASDAELNSLHETWNKSLQTEFGSAFNNRIELARRALNNLGNENLKTLLKDTGLDRHPEMIKLFSNIGKKYLEGDVIVAGDKDGRFGVTPAEAQNRINAKLADREFREAYFSATHINHDNAVKELANLYAIMHN